MSECLTLVLEGRSFRPEVSDSRSKPQVSCLSLMTMTWLRGGLTPDWRAPGAVKCVRDLQMSNMSEKRGRMHFDVARARKLGMDIGVPTAEWTLLSWSFPQRFLERSVFTRAPAPWEVFNVLFSSACSAAVNLIFNGVVFFKASMHLRSLGSGEETGLWHCWGTKLAGGGWCHRAGLAGCPLAAAHPCRKGRTEAADGPDLQPSASQTSRSAVMPWKLSN